MLGDKDFLKVLFEHSSVLLLQGAFESTVALEQLKKHCVVVGSEHRVAGEACNPLWKVLQLKLKATEQTVIVATVCSPGSCW